MISNFSLALPVVYLPMLWCQLDKFCRQAVQQFSLLIVFLNSHNTGLPVQNELDSNHIDDCMDKCCQVWKY